MAEVRYTNRGYCRYKSTEQVLGIALNTVAAFFFGLISFSHELDGSMWRWVLVLYGVGSVVYAGYAMPKYLLTLRWVIGRPAKEMVEIKMVDVSTAVVNGYAWDVCYWDKLEIVLDCEEGVAHMPFRGRVKESL